MKRNRNILRAAVCSTLLCMLLVMSGCGKSQEAVIVNCSKCGAEITLPKGMEADPDFMYMCDDCDKELAKIIEETMGD